MKEILFKSAAEWRRWLAANHAKETGVWVVFAKPSSQLQSIDYASALDEALCFGWIDSIIRRLDDKRYARKFTPRKPDSAWSDINKQHVKRLIKDRRMRAAGLRAIERSKHSGHWQKRPRPGVSTRMPAPFLEALNKEHRARENFDHLPPGERRRFIIWIAIAKRPETRVRRIRESIRLLARNEKLGLK
jgi:uncharacterized protein YdeI (YjbR/CyaY-like superfamily)